MTRVTFFGVLVAAFVAANCDRAPARAPSDDATTTNATVLRSSSARTVDSTGFVDNGGRTSDEVGRTEMSGMRPTEMGSESPTGTPGAGLPLPFTAPPTVAPSREAGSLSSAIVMSRLAEALCERAAVCNPMPPVAGRCLERARARANDVVAQASCQDAFAPAAVARCISAVRSTACRMGPGVIEQCSPRSLCSVD